ncbi:fasciclin-like arabinogalactan protein 6 [Nymphaea colorata]|uniref:fasciclin-like arabinogalactan protein 6 n=1 Tax=Nymphaea colorata TaxID=210225 RepID=UPI00214EC2A3|nr:fasciclin-like arabinogalactan protein 6 [Nymphaea colorata]
MAASQALVILSLCLSSTLLFSSAPAQGQPAPPPPPLNLIDTLQKAGQYSTLIRLLGTTRVGDQLAYQLNNFSKATFFAPTDAAFNSLPSGFLNTMSMEQQVKLLNFHVVPHLFTWNDFKNGVPPQATQASGPNGPYVLTFTFISDQQVKVSTGLVETIFTNALNLTPPLAIYQVDKVLIPPGMFSPSSASSSSPAPGSGSAPSSSASPPSSSAQPLAPSSSSSPLPSAPTPTSSSPPTHAPPSKSAPSPTTPRASAPASTGSAPASTSTETGSAPAGALGPWSLMGSLMAAALATMV